MPFNLHVHSLFQCRLQESPIRQDKNEPLASNYRKPIEAHAFSQLGLQEQPEQCNNSTFYPKGNFFF